MQDLLTLKKCPEDWFPAWTPSIGHSEYWNGRTVSISLKTRVRSWTQNAHQQNLTVTVFLWLYLIKKVYWKERTWLVLSCMQVSKQHLFYGPEKNPYGYWKSWNGSISFCFNNLSAIKRIFLRITSSSERWRLSVCFV